MTHVDGSAHVPEQRSLDVVLAQALAGDEGSCRLIVGTMVSTAGNAHLNVSIEGVTVKVPRLAGVAPAAGKPVYCLVSRDLVLAIGYVTT